MKKTGLLLLFLTSFCSQAATIALAATNSEIIAEMAGQCWTLPDNIDYQTARVVFEVKYDKEGKLSDIVTVEYRPVRRAGQLFAISAMEAIQQCANQTNIKSRTVRVIMDYNATKANDPLNMKR